jgi:hypothetical protein
MAYDLARIASAEAIAITGQGDFRRDERFAVLVGGAALGVFVGGAAALALGRTGWWPLLVTGPMFAIAAYLAIATFRDAIDRRALGCSIAAGLVALSLLAWPAMALIFPMSAPEFWIAPAATVGSMILLASCWSGAQGAVYRLSGEAASVFAIVGFLGLTQLMS